MPTAPDMRDITALRRIMVDLRTSDTGCPWDLEQTFATIAPYTIEEAYEVADAIERGAMDELCDELGDLLLQVVYHAQIAAEAEIFDFDDVVSAICEKMIRRHPHVYGDDAAEGRAKLAKGFWEAMKALERAGRESADASSAAADRQSLLGEVPRALPALSRAVKLQTRAATVGFDWPDRGPVLDKIREELGEVESALADGDDAAAGEEIGDLIFACANLARHLGVNAEAMLAHTNAKFVRRFEHIERRLKETGRTLEDATLEEMDRYWEDAKSSEVG